MRKKRKPWIKRLIYPYLAIAVCLVSILSACSGSLDTDKPKTGGERIDEIVDDTDVNIMQREMLFNHIGYDINSYEVCKSRDTDGNLSQWWYRNKENNSDGVYVAIGDIKANDGEGFAAFGDIIPEIDDSMDYLLEISCGILDEDGYFVMGKETSDYYFVQQGEDIAFVKLIN